jgi:hypothetical protein
MSTETGVQRPGTETTAKAGTHHSVGPWLPFAGPVKWGEIAVVVALLGIGIAARTYQIDYNFDYDELFSTRLAGRSFAEVISQALEDRPHPPLHYLLLHFWISAFGASEISTRLLSVVFSAVFLLAAYALFRRVTVPRIALGSLAQQARPYALIGMLAAINMLAFVLVLEAPESLRRRLLWAISCVLLLYAQYLGGLLIVLEIAFALWRLREHRLPIVLCGLGAIALIGPWFLVAMYRPLFQGVDPLPHIAWMGRPKPLDMIWFYCGVLGFIPALASRWLLIPLACAGLWYLYQVVRARKLGLAESFLLVVALGIPAVVFVVSTVGPKPIFEGRQMTAAAIAFVGALGLFASSLKKGWDVLFLVLLAAWSVAAMPAAFPQVSKPPYREAANEINEQYGTQTVVVLEDWVGDPIAFYRGGHVRLWDELSANEKGQRFLLLCRPFLDSRPGLENSPSRRKPVATWRWGRQSEPTPFSKLDLYEVQPIEVGAK